MSVCVSAFFLMYKRNIYSKLYKNSLQLSLRCNFIKMKVRFVYKSTELYRTSSNFSFMSSWIFRNKRKNSEKAINLKKLYIECTDEVHITQFKRVTVTCDKYIELSDTRLQHPSITNRRGYT